MNLLVDGVVMRDLDGSIHVNGMRDWNHSSYNFDDALGLPERRGGIEQSDQDECTHPLDGQKHFGTIIPVFFFFRSHISLQGGVSAQQRNIRSGFVADIPKT